MRRQRNALAALAVTLLVAALPATGLAQTQLNGTYTLNRQASDDVASAINATVARMNFITRPIARGRLRSTNQPYQRVVINYSPTQVSLAFDQRAPIVTPGNGTPTAWRREDGETLQVSTEWENGRLEQTFRAEDGTRENDFTLSEDGATLTMHVTITSPRLPQPLRYKLVYNRAS